MHRNIDAHSFLWRCSQSAMIGDSFISTLICIIYIAATSESFQRDREQTEKRY